MANRIYYAIQQVRLGKKGGTFDVIRGLQTVGVTTNFNLEQVFEMGHLSIYQNVEEVPDIEVTLNKVLDGYPLIYEMATDHGSAVGGTDLQSKGPTIAGRSNARCDVELSIYPDSGTSASGSAITAMVCSGMYVSSVSYTFPVDGNFTEDVTLVGNNKVWGQSATGYFTSNSGSPSGYPNSGTGVGRRQYLKMESCVFPKQIPGINKSTGINSQVVGSGYGAHFQNITVSADFGREAIQELGTFAPYHRFVTFPVEVTCEFEVVSTSGDNVYATESGYYSGFTGEEPASGSTACGVRRNLLDETIYLETCEGTKISLGTKNKLTSVNYTGGDTGGGNVTVTYSYSTYNDLSVAHTGGQWAGAVSAGSS
jgi:hypothetical protein